MKAISLGLHPGLDEQLVAQRHDFHDLLARLDVGADGRDLDVVDDAVDRRADLGAVTLPSAPRSDCSLTAIFAVTWLRSSSACWRNSKVGLRRLGLRLADRGHRLALLLARGGDPALKVDDFAPLFDQVGFGNDVLGRERLDHRDLVLRKREAALQAADRRRGFGRRRAAPGRRVACERRDLAAKRRLRGPRAEPLRQRNPCLRRRLAAQSLPAVSRETRPAANRSRPGAGPVARLSGLSRRASSSPLWTAGPSGRAAR